MKKLIIIVLIVSVLIAGCKLDGKIFGKSSNLTVVQDIAKDYYKTHTYSKVDFFVCSDMSIDVWNLIKSKGIDAKIMAGNINKNLSKSEGWEYIRQMDHTWVLAQINSTKWVAVEATGGFIVKDNQSYFEGISFDSPKEFKEFAELRDDAFDICKEADEMVNTWNSQYAGESYSLEIAEFEGRVKQKVEDCKDVTDRVNGYLS